MAYPRRSKPRTQPTGRPADKGDPLKQGSAAMAMMRGLAMPFKGILHSCSPKIYACKPSHWSNGKAEGQ